MSTAGAAAIAAHRVPHRGAEPQLGRPDPTTGEFAWQQDRLGELKAELARCAETQDVVESLAGAGLRLLRGDSAVVALYDPQRQRHRIAAIRGDATFWPPCGTELSWGEEYLPKGSVLLLPRERPYHPLAPHLLSSERAGLLIGLRFGEESLGFVAVLRGYVPEFDVSDRVLARGLADEGTRALANARVRRGLRDMRSARSEVLAVVSHELRTPLNAILGFSELLRESTRDAAIASDVARIETAGRTLLDVVESLVAVGNLTAGSEVTETRAVPFRDFWDRLGRECAALAVGSRVAFVWDAPSFDAVLRTDVAKVETVVRHLVRNALKFTHDGFVRVTALARGRELHLAVSDTGIGIPPRQLADVFEPFWQADSSMSRKYSGLGLGLYLAKHHVTRLGGTIAVRSTGRAGSTFNVNLPDVLEDAGRS